MNERDQQTVQPIEIIGIFNETLIPQQTDKFWASATNK